MNNSPKRVVITGLGFVSSLGSDKDTLWSLMEESYKKPEAISKFNTDSFSSKTGYPMPESFSIKNYTEDSGIRRKEWYSQMVVAAGLKAVEDAGLTQDDIGDSDRYGSILTTVHGPISVTFKYLNDLVLGGPKQASPNYFQQTVFNVAGGQLSILLKLKGVSSTLVGCSSINYAFELIKSNRADMILVGGMEEMHQHIYYGYDKRSLLAKDQGDGENSLPLSKKANGAVLGEGSGIVVLESLDHALKRNARIYTEIIDHVAMTDRIFNKNFSELGSEESEGFFKTMNRLIQRNGLSTEDIDFVSLAANSHPEVDKSEIRALKKICEPANAKWSAVASKAIFGETLGNSELFALIPALMCFEKKKVPTLQYLTDEEYQDLKILDNTEREKTGQGIVNSFFVGGGINSMLLRDIEKCG